MNFDIVDPSVVITLTEEVKKNKRLIKKMRTRMFFRDLALLGVIVYLYSEYKKKEEEKIEE